MHRFLVEYRVNFFFMKKKKKNYDFRSVLNHFLKHKILLRFHICYDRVYAMRWSNSEDFKRFLIYPNVAIPYNFILCPDVGSRTCDNNKGRWNKSKKSSHNLWPMKLFREPIEFNLTTQLNVNSNYKCFQWENFSLPSFFFFSSEFGEWSPFGFGKSCSRFEET